MTEVRRDLDGFVQQDENGLSHLDLAVDGITCAGCMAKIERELKSVPGVTGARVNLTSHRLAVDWDAGQTAPDSFLERLQKIGYSAFPFDPKQISKVQADRSKTLLRALAVAGFAAMNIMLLSISVWAGNVTGIAQETRDLLHWISALIAIPAVAYAGQPFFRSALVSFQARNLNMDVPISLAVLLAVGMSIFQTFTSARDAYFDSAVMLLFFLLVGRFLDENMRRRTSSLAENLVTLRGQSATRREDDGSLTEVPLSALAPGDLVHVAAGERIGVDGEVVSGMSDIDLSLVTGETAPERVEPGSKVIGGTLNQSGNLLIRVEAVLKGTVLEEIGRLLENAAQVRARYVQLADRAARAYVPIVHSAAALTLIGWLIYGADWQSALLNAISVLIITCPCALGLAVPVVQVVASSVLFRAGVLISSGDALERLAEIDTVIFDKTGTLTMPVPQVLNTDEIAPDLLQRAGRIAAASRHPLAEAIARAAGVDTPLEGVTEEPGRGVRASGASGEIRLGNAEFCGLDPEALPELTTGSRIWYREGEAPPVEFRLAQSLRADAKSTIDQLKALGLEVEILSGDTEAAVAAAAAELGIDHWRAGLKPADKIARLEQLQAEGRKPAMVGDGLNDAPCLSAAHASLSPVSAADISRAAADFVFMGDGLAPILTALATARMSRRLMLENLGFAALYNTIAVPLAVLGFVNPLIAALAMSGSSIIVTLNALRTHLLNRTSKPE
ncbi:MAG: copper-translocating P-type ATPase [Hyphomicrobiales bacterium]|nr:MAG: copper-translocating P-type ATPase [Hyphomicrobiales bacterium]